VNGETARKTLGAVMHDAGLDWIVPDWPAPANVRAFATTRAGGVSIGSYASMNLGRNSRDDPSALAENQRRFEAFLPAKPARLDQVHGTAVATLQRAGSTAPATVADAVVTRERGVVCAILTADCLPVLFADRSGTAVGIAHAGWRGLAAGVLEATIDALHGLGAQPRDLATWLGPAIGPAAFEVGEDVFTAFRTEDPRAGACFAPHRPGKWHADLYGLARQRLARRGVTRVHGGGFCTFTESARFFSYRRERESGRMATAIWLAR
jgi:YfiH family protein